MNPGVGLVSSRQSLTALCRIQPERFGGRWSSLYISVDPPLPPPPRACWRNEAAIIKPHSVSFNLHVRIDIFSLKMPTRTGKRSEYSSSLMSIPRLPLQSYFRWLMKNFGPPGSSARVAAAPMERKDSISKPMPYWQGREVG
jgi:hypothetical protein